MAQWGFSVAGLFKAIENMYEMKGKIKIASEKSYVVSPDHKATETDGPYPPYAVLQEFGWTGNSGSPYMRTAVNTTQAQMSAIVNAVSSNISVIDDDAPDALMKAVAKRIQEAAKKNAPKDTGELAFGIDGRGIFVEEVDSNEHS